MKILSIHGVSETLCEHMNDFATMREFSVSAETGLIEADFVIIGGPDKVPAGIADNIGISFANFEIIDEPFFASKARIAYIRLSIQTQLVNGEWMYVSSEGSN